MTLEFTNFKNLNMTTQEDNDLKTREVIKESYAKELEKSNILFLYADYERLQIYVSLIGEAKSCRDLRRELKLATTSAHRKFNQLIEKGLILPQGKKNQEHPEYLYIAKYPKIFVEFTKNEIKIKTTRKKKGVNK